MAGNLSIHEKGRHLDERNALPQVLVKHRRASGFAPEASVKYVFYVCKCLATAEAREKT
jgi:hypothetical protein